jgi:hypothetical protein
MISEMDVANKKVMDQIFADLIEQGGKVTEV